VNVAPARHQRFREATMPRTSAHGWTSIASLLSTLRSDDSANS
jgi:hypothetical protein